MSLFWLAYHHPEKSRLAGVVLIDSPDLLHTRLHADMAGLGVGCTFAEGYALNEAWRSHVPTGMTGRLLSPDEARRLLERIERTRGIVSKRRGRPYRSGRSPDWIKVKNPEAPAATRILE